MGVRGTFTYQTAGVFPTLTLGRARAAGTRCGRPNHSRITDYTGLLQSCRSTINTHSCRRSGREVVNREISFAPFRSIDPRASDVGKHDCEKKEKNYETFQTCTLDETLSPTLILPVWVCGKCLEYLQIYKGDTGGSLVHSERPADGMDSTSSRNSLVLH